MGLAPMTVRPKRISPSQLILEMDQGPLASFLPARAQPPHRPRRWLKPTAAASGFRSPLHVCPAALSSPSLCREATSSHPTTWLSSLSLSCPAHSCRRTRALRCSLRCTATLLLAQTSCAADELIASSTSCVPLPRAEAQPQTAGR
jgi:hypothetical protein